MKRDKRKARKLKRDRQLANLAQSQYRKYQCMCHKHRMREK